LRDLFPEEFDRRTEREYMLLKALGVYSLHWLAKDIFQMCLKQALDFRETEVLKGILIPLKSFDWNIKTSPLSALGGMKGAGRAHEILLETFNQKVSMSTL
jgi:hypothetical protein